VNFGLGAAPPEAYIQIAPGEKFCGEARWAVGIGRRMFYYKVTAELVWKNF